MRLGSKSGQLTTIFPLKSLGMVPSTQVPFILFSTLSSSWNTHTHTYLHTAEEAESQMVEGDSRRLTTLHSSCTSCCMKLSKVSHLEKERDSFKPLVVSVDVTAEGFEDAF